VTDPATRNHRGRMILIWITVWILWQWVRVPGFHLRHLPSCVVLALVLHQLWSGSTLARGFLVLSLGTFGAVFFAVAVHDLFAGHASWYAARWLAESFVALSIALVLWRHRDVRSYLAGRRATPTES